jgi:two-component system chemotaxis response regulator CheB
MLVQQGRVVLSHGPRENRSRPAIDPLFRSAAQAYGPRVVGVVLSGALGDGAMGLVVISARGGVTVVQDPHEALFDSMPRTALQHTRVDYTLPVAQIAPLLVRLAGEPVAEKGSPRMDDAEENLPTLIRRDFNAQAHGQRAGETTVYTCPECGGTLWQIDDDGLIQFNCHVGHSYLAETLLSEMSDELEGALWACVRMLAEKATLTRQLASRLRGAGQEAHAARVEEQAEADDRHGQLIRDTLLETPSSPTAETLAVEEALDEGS